MVHITLDSTDFKVKSTRFDNVMRMRILDFVANSMETIRLDAANNSLIPNVTGYRNPYYARMMQESTAGRLTQRTGKMAMLLEEDTNKPFGGGIVRTKETTAFQIRAYTSPKNAMSEYYRGQLRLEVKSALPNFVVFRGRHPRKGERGFDVMPQETPLTIKFRFMWENRRKGKRPYLLPALERKYSHILEDANKIVNEVTMYMK